MAADPFVKRLRSAMKARRLSAVGLADRAGLSNSYVTQLLTRRIKSPCLNALKALAVGLEVPPGWLAVGAGQVGALEPFPARESLVYFIRRVSDGAIKIGHSVRPLARLQTFQIASAERLELVATLDGGQRVEHELHRRFASARIIGEWFAPVPELLALVAARVEAA